MNSQDAKTQRFQDCADPVQCKKHTDATCNLQPATCNKPYRFLFGCGSAALSLSVLAVH